MLIKSLQSIGWDSFFLEQLISSKHNKYTPAKVVSQHNDRYHLVSEQEDFTAKVTGKFRFNANHLRDYPVVGDFVLVELIEESNHYSGYERAATVGRGR